VVINETDIGIVADAQILTELENQLSNQCECWHALCLDMECPEPAHVLHGSYDPESTVASFRCNGEVKFGVNDLGAGVFGNNARICDGECLETCQNAGFLLAAL